MKAEWQTKKLGEVCEVIAGQSPEGKYYNNERKGLPFYQGKKAFSGKFLAEPKIWTTKITKEARPGDVLMSVRAPVGPVNFATQIICIGRGLAAIRATDAIDRDFLFNFLLKHESEIVGNTGAVFDSINKAQIENISIPIPSLSEQQRIVAILDKAFDGIATAKANAEKNLQNASALFESHLQSVFTDALKTGELVMLADLATDISDGDHMPPPKAPSGVPFITIRNIAKDTRTINFADTFMVSREYFDKLRPNKKPKKGDVLYTVTGSYGVPVLVTESRDFCFQRHIGLVRPKPEVNSQWLYYLLMSPQILRQANDGATGTAQKTVSLKLLRGFQVPRIPLALQLVVVEKLNSTAQETQRLTALYQQKLAALDELKKALLHQAFSGQLGSHFVEKTIP